MIGSLSGVLAEADYNSDSLASIVVDVEGVGYEVVVSARHAAQLGPIGAPVAVAVYTHVREGAITLYGLADRTERRTFELLIGAHGVGPALALAILSVHPPDSLAQAVAGGDVDALVLVPGVGRKTAQRLIVELAGRLGTIDAVPTGAGATDGTRLAKSEVRAALAALGYAPDEVRHALERLSREGSVEELLREALQSLAPRR
ncbi:MAG TPA: Holliday junction branch migration protein RuvA [Acidimicrobiales bacterium]|nr:Holliday junction branch migration protein RuvA [Acidimicrobiales bacterium]